MADSPQQCSFSQIVCQLIFAADFINLPENVKFTQLQLPHLLRRADDTVVVKNLPVQIQNIIPGQPDRKIGQSFRVNPGGQLFKLLIFSPVFFKAHLLVYFRKCRRTVTVKHFIQAS